MSKLVLGHSLLNEIADAFGLSLEVSRVVIDIPCDGMVKAIIVDHLTEEKKDVLLVALKAANVEVVA